MAAPSRNGHNGHIRSLGETEPSQTPVPLPNYTPQPPQRSVSAPSASQMQTTSASPAPSDTPVPAQFSSPMGSLNKGPYQPPPTQNGNATPNRTSQQAQAPGPLHVSPGAQPQPDNVESLNIYQAMATLVERAPATAVRQVVRDKWEKTLLGSQYHIAFLLNATMHQASPGTITKAVQNFGANIAKNAKHELMGHLGPDDVDDLMDLILSRASSQFLDRALAMRLETIPARQLVNALARAERLGYDIQDIVRDHDEQVIPSMHSVPTQSAMPAPIPSAHRPDPPNPAIRIRYRQYQPDPVPSQQPQSTASPVPSQAQSTEYPKGPPGLSWCRCGWPCASDAALEYHKKKNACYKVETHDEAGRDICLYCGCRFTSSGGLLYHEKSSVCGDHSRDTAKQMHALIDHIQERKKQIASTRTPRAQAQPSSTQPPVNWATPTVQSTGTPGSNPYSHLTREKLAEFNQIMKNAEEKYGGLMRDASLLDEPERTKRLASLKNSYNTKQSTTRKKFGIRLRERRNRAEIEAEEARLFNSPGRNGTPINGTSGLDGESRPKKRTRTDDIESGPSSIGIGMNGSQESPQKRIPRSEMGGGLSGSQATAELNDPTAQLNTSQLRYTQRPPTISSQNNTRWSPNRAKGAIAGTQQDPMSIDDSSSDSDSDDDGDIPATIY
ncbi:hypothetical protein NW768_006520 [Fusarium equiseti]|uniref:C2H2-type domain-containing protein n=1 Tax=Fusarium equiseti TaxID=61235 RepID=A0ABQ8RBQ3_FUSEQ|nr:hypothetical protein NW768_006520 [Fusarium equiseti]